MRILVTGGAGFIGSNVADAFVEAGNEVFVIDDLSSGVRAYVPQAAAFLQASVSDGACRGAFESFRPEVLCHHAAQIDVRRSVEDPAADAEVNVVGTLRLLELCRAFGTRRILFASTEIGRAS